jgi:hypothetical protein
MPKFSTILLIAVGLFILSAISIAPNGTRKPVMLADGTVAHSPDGKVLTVLDNLSTLKSNWFGFATLLLAPVVLVLAIARLIWSIFKRDNKDDTVG